MVGTRLTHVSGPAAHPQRLAPHRRRLAVQRRRSGDAPTVHKPRGVRGGGVRAPKGHESREEKTGLQGTFGPTNVPCRISDEHQTDGQTGALCLDDALSAQGHARAPECVWGVGFGTRPRYQIV